MQTSNVESRLNDRIGGLDILIGKELQSQPVAVLMLQPMYGYLYLLLADRLGCRLYVELENALGEPAKPVSIANKDIHNGVRGCMHDDLSLHFEVSIYGDAYKRFSDNGGAQTADVGRICSLLKVSCMTQSRREMQRVASQT